jgi:hypothetical protein
MRASLAEDSGTETAGLRRLNLFRYLCLQAATALLPLTFLTFALALEVPHDSVPRAGCFGLYAGSSAASR